jgi:hypothetical protein
MRNNGHATLHLLLDCNPTTKVRGCLASSPIITRRFETQVEITIAMVLSNVKDERASTLSLEFSHTFELDHENDCARILRIQHFCLRHNISWVGENKDLLPTLIGGHINNTYNHLWWSFWFCANIYKHETLVCYHICNMSRAIWVGKK